MSKAKRAPRAPARPAPARAAEAPPPLAAVESPVRVRLVWAALVLTLLLRVAGCFTRSNWAWGIDTFRHAGLPWTAVLAALAALGFVPPVARVLERALGAAGRAWERAGAWGDLAIGLGGGLALLPLRDELRFTGDAVIRAGLLKLTIPEATRLLHFAFPLDQVVNFDVPRQLWLAGASPETALQWVGAAMGGLFAFAAAAFLREAGARGAALAGAGIVLLAGGALVHFPGYDKFGPLVLGLALAAKGAVGLARRGRGLVALAAGTAVCVFAHRSGYLVLPAVAWTLWRAFRGAGEGRRRREVAVAGLVVLAAAAVMLPRAASVALTYDREVHLRVGGAGAGGALLDLADRLNVLFFAVPLWLAGLAAAWPARAPAESADRHPRGRFPLAPVAWLGLGGLALVLAAVRPGGGWARDWDVADPVVAVAGMATAALLARAWSRGAGARTLAPAVTLALATGLALWTVSVSVDAGLRRAEALLLDSPVPDATVRANTWDTLTLWALKTSRLEQAAQFSERSIACAPNPRQFYQLGLARLGLGQLDRARAAFLRGTVLTPRNGDPWYGLARTALAAGDTLGATAALDSALARNPDGTDPNAMRQDLLAAGAYRPR